MLKKFATSFIEQNDMNRNINTAFSLQIIIMASWTPTGSHLTFPPADGGCPSSQADMHSGLSALALLITLVKYLIFRLPSINGLSRY